MRGVSAAKEDVHTQQAEQTVAHGINGYAGKENAHRRRHKHGHKRP